MPTVLGLQVIFHSAGEKSDYLANTFRSFDRSISVEESNGTEEASKQIILRGNHSTPCTKYFFECKHGLNPKICNLNNPSVFLRDYRASQNAISKRNSCIQEIHNSCKV
jgi:hypothetical protein